MAVLGWFTAILLGLASYTAQRNQLFLNQTINELKSNEFRKPELFIADRLHPVSKLGNVQFIYHLSDLERRQLKVRLDNPGVVAIIT